jgi:Domain of unknown function (DUF4279)
VETGATFRLFGDDAALTAAAVTARLGIEPSRAYEAGEPRGKHQEPRDSSSWQLGTDIAAGVELDAQLATLLAQLEPVSAQLWDLVNEGYEPNWFCFIASNTTEHAVELDRNLLARLTALPGDLWLDVCGKD